jgi:hypothetical protein
MTCPANVDGGEERTATAGGAPRTAVARGVKHGNVMLEQFYIAVRFRSISDILDPAQGGMRRAYALRGVEGVARRLRPSRRRERADNLNQ